ncbi:MAG: GNAT family N-acetyltransferase [Terracidiphilus sp.]|jgi:GNAT superfamily N-acetyltransferase
MATIRKATKADIPQIYAFICALAEYEHVPPEAVHATEAGIARDGFGVNPLFYCLLAEQDGRPAGFAIYLFNYSTFDGQVALHVEDLYVVPELRGLGIGKELLAFAATVALEMGSRRMQWEVLDWNLPAIEFYGTLGANFVDQWRNMRLTGKAVEELARYTGCGTQQAAA